MRRPLASLVLAGTLVACGGTEAADEASGEATGAPTATAGAGGASAVPSALDFTATLVDGTTFDARQYAGETVVFWFWAPF